MRRICNWSAAIFWRHGRDRQSIHTRRNAAADHLSCPHMLGGDLDPVLFAEHRNNGHDLPTVERRNDGLELSHGAATNADAVSEPVIVAALALLRRLRQGFERRDLQRRQRGPATVYAQRKAHAVDSADGGPFIGANEREQVARQDRLGRNDLTLARCCMRNSTGTRAAIPSRCISSRARNSVCGVVVRITHVVMCCLSARRAHNAATRGLGFRLLSRCA